jgi:hypothetical protein
MNKLTAKSTVLRNRLLFFIAMGFFLSIPSVWAATIASTAAGGNWSR